VKTALQIGCGIMIGFVGIALCVIVGLVVLGVLSTAAITSVVTTRAATATAARATTSTPTPVPTSSPTSEPERFSLPYSYEGTGLKITVLEVIPVPKEEAYRSPGYREWEVKLRLENLLKEDWRRGCAGFESFKLKTDRENVYTLTYSGAAPYCGGFLPEQVYTTRWHLVTFRIREDETPLELWGNFDRDKREPDYIFELVQ